MAYKVLGQSAPSANTNTTLYTVPASKEAIVSTIVICNRGTTAGFYSIAVRPAGATLANQHYIVFNSYLSANQAFTLTLGIALATTDVITISSSSSSFSFSAFGNEVTA